MRTTNTHVLSRVEPLGDGSLRLTSRWHQLAGNLISVVLLLFIAGQEVVVGSGPQWLRWSFAAPFVLLGVGHLLVFRHRRTVFFDASGRQVTVRDRMVLPGVGEWAVPFDEVRGVGTVRMTPSDPRSSSRMVTLHLDGEDRYLITVPGRWENRDIEDRLRAIVSSAVRGPFQTPDEGSRGVR